MTHAVKSSLVLATLAVLLVGCGYAGELKIGETAPDFQSIIGVDGNKHGLADYQQAKLVVVVFTCNHCPVAAAYEDRLIALQKQYAAQGVQFVAINVNNIAADRLEE